MRTRTWSLLRWILTGLFAFIAARVTLPDYPYGIPLWNSLTMDPNGYWHELFYIAVGWLVSLDLTYHLEHKSRSSRHLVIVKKRVAVRKDGS